jgi:hypothetical protein
MRKHKTLVLALVALFAAILLQSYYASADRYARKMYPNNDSSRTTATTDPVKCLFRTNPDTLGWDSDAAVRGNIFNAVEELSWIYSGGVKIRTIKGLPSSVYFKTYLTAWNADTDSFTIYLMGYEYGKYIALDTLQVGGTNGVTYPSTAGSPLIWKPTPTFAFMDSMVFQFNEMSADTFAFRNSTVELVYDY